MAPKQHTPSKKATAEQRDRFIETARTLGCDENEAAFKAKLAVIGRQKPKDALEAPKKARKT